MAPIKTWDHLGVLHRKYSHRLCRRFFQEGQGFGALVDTTFGENLDVLKPYLEKASVARLHLLNNTAVRNKKNLPTEMLHRYGNGPDNLERLDADARRVGSPLYGLIDKQLLRIEPIVKSFRGRLLISALLEHNLSVTGAMKVADYVRGKGFEVVDNPMARNYPKIGFALYETHGNNKRGVDIISHDGISAFDANYIISDRDSTPYQQSADELEAYWIDTLNGRYTGLKEWIDPRKRVFFPTEYELRYIEQLMKPTPAVPRVRGYKLLAAPQIWKAASEDYKTGRDPRQGLPVFIGKDKLSRVTLKTLEGRKIKDMPYYGTIDSRFRYYLGGTGMDHFSVFKANGEREFCLLDAGSQRLIINIFRRCGVER